MSLHGKQLFINIRTPFPMHGAHPESFFFTAFLSIALVKDSITGHDAADKLALHYKKLWVNYLVLPHARYISMGQIQSV